MHPLPHQYRVSASLTSDETVSVAGEGLSPLSTTTPPQFGGPPGQWSPETLLVGAVADCFALTFRGIARRVNAVWTSMHCQVIGTLDRKDGVTQFTNFAFDVTVTVPRDVDEKPIREVAVKAERGCLITNSMKATVDLNTRITVSEQPAAA